MSASPLDPAPARWAEREDFLTAGGWSAARRAPLAGDASARRYTRLYGPAGRTAMLMDAPPAAGEDVAPFAALTGLLRDRGFSAPEILAADLSRGFLVLEDLGDALFAGLAAADPRRERPLYEAAVDLLAALHAEPPPAEARLGAPAAAALRLAPYDGTVLRDEARLFVDWWLPGVAGAALDEAVAEAFDAALREALGAAAQARDVLVLRDYHAENLIWLPGRTGAARVGLLDYQDALVGHPAYDLMSLLEDARRDVDPALAEGMIRRYVAAAGVPDGDAFGAAYAGLAAARNLKIIGIFSRLWLRDGKPRYLAMIPRVWDHLRRDLAHPACAALAAWVSEHGPAPSAEALARLRARAPQSGAGRAAPAATPPRDVRAKEARLGALLAQPAPPNPPPVEIDTAMILAAGLGARMRPLTDDRPKPLIEAAGAPLIDHAIGQATRAGARRLVVNAHYRAEMIAAHLDGVGRAQPSLEIRISDERAALLETGGGVARALPLIDREIFYVLNSDAVWSERQALTALRAAWNSRLMDALLLLAPRLAARSHAGRGDFSLDPLGRLVRRGARDDAPFVYTGAQIVTAASFDAAPAGAFSMNRIWDALIARGRAFGVVCAGLWVDVGAPAGLDAVEAALAEAAPTATGAPDAERV